MLEEGGSYFGKDDLFFPLRNCLPDRTATKRTLLRRINRAFLGRLVSRPNPLGVPGWRVGRAFLGQITVPFPFGALGLGRLARGAGPGPKVPTPPRKYPKKFSIHKIDVHIVTQNIILIQEIKILIII